MSPTAADEELELQILGDIQDVFGSWRDDDEEDESSADELGQSAPQQHPGSSSGRPDLTIPLLRSQARLSKRTIEQAMAALPAAPPAKRARRAPSDIFAPFSTADYFDRLGSFNLLNFSASAFPASEAARAGWSSGGRDRLKCGCCEAAWKVSAFTGLKGPAREKLADRMRALLKEKHRPSCPWRIGIDLLEKAGPGPVAEVKPLRPADVSRRAEEMRPHLPAALALTHPLTDADLAAMTAALRPRPRAATRSPARPDDSATPAALAADILAVFHWQLLPSPSPGARSASQATSTTASTELAATPAAAAPTVVTCALCSRRLGLWSFTAARPLDVVASHGTVCPSLSISVADRLRTLAEPDLTPQPDRRQVRDLVDALLGPKVTLEEVRGWKIEIDRLEGSATVGHTSTRTQGDAP